MLSLEDLPLPTILHLQYILYHTVFLPCLPGAKLSVDYVSDFLESLYAPWHDGLSLALHVSKRNTLGIASVRDCIVPFWRLTSRAGGMVCAGVLIARRCVAPLSWQKYIFLRHT